MVTARGAVIINNRLRFSNVEQPEGNRLKTNIEEGDSVELKLEHLEVGTHDKQDAIDVGEELTLECDKIDGDTIRLDRLPNHLIDDAEDDFWLSHTRTTSKDDIQTFNFKADIQQLKKADGQVIELKADPDDDKPTESDPSGNTVVNYCPSCGSDLSDISQPAYCPSCGHEL